MKLNKILFAACICFTLISTGFSQGKSPKNIIILIGDGMGPTYVSTSVLSMKNDSFRRFTTVGFSVTCSADNLITDSAAGATAYSAGERTNNGYIAFSTDKKPLQTILELAETKNLATGVVSTSSVTHATPASFVAHDEDRGHQVEIAKDFLDLSIDVVIGGGNKFFLPEGKGGVRKDGLDLIETARNNGYDYFDDPDEFLEVPHTNNFYALLDEESLPKACDRDYTLGQLTEAALTKLSSNENGFVVMIEGSQIDWAGHNNDEDYLLSEMKDFNTAINTALDFAEKDSSTLVIVVADHETGGAAITGGSLDGEDIELKFVYDHHSAAMVGVFAKGPGEELFGRIQDNYIIGQKLMEFVRNRK